MVQIRCSMCGKAVELNPMDKNYEAAKQGKTVFYICTTCSNKATSEARKKQK